jgi:hypothetical protein
LSPFLPLPLSVFDNHDGVGLLRGRPKGRQHAGDGDVHRNGLPRANQLQLPRAKEMRARARTHTHTHTHTHTQKTHHTRTHIHARKHIYAIIVTRTQTRTERHTHIQTHTHARARAPTHAHRHTPQHVSHLRHGHTLPLFPCDIPQVHKSVHSQPHRTCSAESPVSKLIYLSRVAAGTSLQRNTTCVTILPDTEIGLTGKERVQLYSIVFQW